MPFPVPGCEGGILKLEGSGPGSGLEDFRKSGKKGGKAFRGIGNPVSFPGEGGGPVAEGNPVTVIGLAGLVVPVPEGEAHGRTALKGSKVKAVAPPGSGKSEGAAFSRSNEAAAGGGKVAVGAAFPMGEGREGEEAPEEQSGES